jgi:hypothetical protein
MRDQVFRDFRRYTEYQIHGSVNHASIVESADQFCTRAGCLFRSFENDRTAGGKCDADAYAPLGLSESSKAKRRQRDQPVP